MKNDTTKKPAGKEKNVASGSQQTTASSRTKSSRADEKTATQKTKASSGRGLANEGTIASYEEEDD